MERIARRPLAVAARENRVAGVLGAVYGWLKSLLSYDSINYVHLVEARLLAELRYDRAERDLYR